MIAFRKDFYLDPFVLGTYILRGRFQDAETSGFDVVPHAGLGEDDERTLRVPLFVAFGRDRAPESDVGMVVRFRLLRLECEPEIGIVFGCEQEAGRDFPVMV